MSYGIILKFPAQSGSDDVQSAMELLADDLGVRIIKIYWNVWHINGNTDEIAAWLYEENFEEGDYEIIQV